MCNEARPDFSFIVRDNEQATARAMERGDFVQAYLLLHALTEALLRLFLHIAENKSLTYYNLVQRYRAYLKQANYPIPTFVDELIQLNRRRNRIVHQLWRHGFSFTNRQTEAAAGAAVTLYGLFIEWIETFDPEVTHLGFRHGDVG